MSLDDPWHPLRSPVDDPWMRLEKETGRLHLGTVKHRTRDLQLGMDVGGPMLTGFRGLAIHIEGQNPATKPALPHPVVGTGCSVLFPRSATERTSMLQVYWLARQESLQSRQPSAVPPTGQPSPLHQVHGWVIAYSLRTISMHMTAARMSCRTTSSAATLSDICNT